MAIESLRAPVDGSSLTGPSGRIRIPVGASAVRRYFTFAGPAFLVSVGYMDPGNWGTDIPAGARYGYELLWVVVLSSLMAMFLQTLSARLGIASGRDLAEWCRDSFPRPISVTLWLLAEIAIVACDLAEVIGSALALNLLFHLPMLYGVLLTSFDVLLLMGLMRFGFRKLEAMVLALVGTISACFVIELWLAKPDWGGVLAGAFRPALRGHDQLILAVGILGATVMPHNLYLHSAMVGTRVTESDDEAKAEAIRNNTGDTMLALTIALLVNAAILVLAAATFHRAGTILPAGHELKQAYRMLTPMLGGAASVVFAIGLLAAGQSSTITGTLAGQVVMEGFQRWKLDPWKRRLMSRCLAIIPAAMIVAGKTGSGVEGLLIASQVVLSLQLPFAIFPLIAFTSSERRMGRFASSRAWTVVGYSVGGAITLLNVLIVLQTFGLIQ